MKINVHVVNGYKSMYFTANLPSETDLPDTYSHVDTLDMPHMSYMKCLQWFDTLHLEASEDLLNLIQSGINNA